MVIDPIQSVKGKVVIDAFRSISPQQVMMGIEPRQSTSNVGHLQQPSIQVIPAAHQRRTSSLQNRLSRVPVPAHASAVSLGSDPRLEPPLLLDRHRLSENGP